MIHRAVGVVVGLLVIAAASAPAQALDLSQWVPGLKLSPFLAERVQYESNVFQVPSGSQSDVVFKTIPGFLADYTFGPHTASVGFRAEILNYVQLTSQDTVNYIGVAQYKLELPRLTAGFRNDYIHTNDPPSTELTGPIESTTNVLVPEAEYKITDRFSVGVNGGWTHVRFDTQDLASLLDRDEYTGGGSLFWKILPRADLKLNYSYTHKSFTESSDLNVNVHQVTIGVRGDITPKMSSTFRIGYQKRDPETSTQPGYSGLVAGGEWVYRPTEQFTFTLLTDRSVVESSFGDVPYYVTTNGTLVAQYQYNAKLSANAKVGGGVNDYPTKQTINNQTKWRTDTFFVASVGLDYQIQRWLLVGIEYSHLFRTSNFDTFNFKDDKVVGKVTLQF